MDTFEMWVIILASLISAASTATDAACTTDGTLLTPTAIACTDKEPALCPVVITGNAATPAGRDPLCVKDGTPATDPEPNFKKFVVEKCAKYCGYCCLTPEYNCPNKPYPQTGLNCTTLSDKCTDPTWRPLIAENCPNVCGMCLAGGCVDKAPDCASQQTICFNTNFQAWANENCARTCNKCPPAAGATTAATTAAPGGNNPPAAATTTRAANTPANCVDLDVNCANWARNGKFCNNTWYADQWYKCRKACGKC